MYDKELKCSIQLTHVSGQTPHVTENVQGLQPPQESFKNPHPPGPLRKSVARMCESLIGWAILLRPAIRSPQEQAAEIWYLNIVYGKCFRKIELNYVII